MYEGRIGRDLNLGNDFGGLGREPNGVGMRKNRWDHGHGLGHLKQYEKTQT